MQQEISNGKVLPKNLKAWETIGGYALLLENVLKHPSEASFPKSAKEIDDKLLVLHHLLFTRFEGL